MEGLFTVKMQKFCQQFCKKIEFLVAAQPFHNLLRIAEYLLPKTARKGSFYETKQMREENRMLHCINNSNEQEKLSICKSMFCAHDSCPSSTFSTRKGQP